MLSSKLLIQLLNKASRSGNLPLLDSICKGVDISLATELLESVPNGGIILGIIREVGANHSVKSLYDLLGMIDMSPVEFIDALLADLLGG